jgi:hypothetical protein
VQEVAVETRVALLRPPRMDLVGKAVRHVVAPS